MLIAHAMLVPEDIFARSRLQQAGIHGFPDRV
jgi:hypothetical protein